MAHRRPARQAINEVRRSILLNKFSKKIVFTMNEVDKGALKLVNDLTVLFGRKRSEINFLKRSERVIYSANS
jgi:hypothetical protein